MWEVVLEKYNCCTHKTLITTYRFDEESDAIDFANSLKKEDSKCGILVCSLYFDFYGYVFNDDIDRRG